MTAASMSKAWRGRCRRLVGVSRVEDATSIYLANRGIRTASMPLVGIPPPHQLKR
jgi:regulator of PEP synthase PpsR (kinase-PPPase family)